MPGAILLIEDVSIWDFFSIFNPELFAPYICVSAVKFCDPFTVEKA
jgi:hypothetical protein